MSGKYMGLGPQNFSNLVKKGPRLLFLPILKILFQIEVVKYTGMTLKI
jgi:hypothetical protein